MIYRLNGEPDVAWVLGTVTAAHPLAEVTGDNGRVYLVKDSGMTPGQRASDLRIGDRVRFEDRQGYVLDLRRTG